MIETIDVFPTKFFTHKISDNEVLQNIYDEIYSKRDKIRNTSWATQHQSSDCYITDYQNTVNIDSFLVALEIFQKELNQNGLAFDLQNYWTTLYKKVAHHPMHIHRSKIVMPNNYDGIFYVTSTGSTNFYSNNPSSFDNEITLPSESGRFVLFPSTLPHQVITNLESDEERCVIAFNGELKEL